MRYWKSPQQSAPNTLWDAAIIDSAYFQAGLSDENKIIRYECESQPQRGEEGPLEGYPGILGSSTQVPIVRLDKWTTLHVLERREVNVFRTMPL